MISYMKKKINIPNTPSSGEAVLVEVEGQAIALFNVGGKFYAIDDECPHAGWKLSEGELTGNVVTCLLHGAEFDVRNGKCIGGLTCSDVQCYPLEEKNGEFFIEID